MSPLPDELRTALSSRTASVSPSPDFLARVERQATRIRRRRVAGAVAGSALAVTALGLGGPLLVSSLTSAAPNPSEFATSAPEPGPSTTELDPAAPWEYRGDPALRAGLENAVARTWAQSRGLERSAVTLTPLYAGYGPGQDETHMVFLAQTLDGAPHWGVAQTRAGQDGLDLAVDQPLGGGTFGLPYAYRTADGDRLLLVAHPATTLEYNPGGQAPWRVMESLAPGVGVTDLDGDPGGDYVSIKGPDGLVSFSPPSLPPAELEDEGPGTDTPLDVDPAPYALDLSEPWAYRGPAELTRHPDLVSADTRLFTERGPGRSFWSSRPLAAVELDDGLSVVMVWHATPEDYAVVTTTWQRQDEDPQQSEQQVTTTDTLLLQSFVSSADGSGLLLALAAPRAGAVETDLPGAGEPVESDAGLAAWQLPADPAAGSVFLYEPGDGLLYHSEPARRS